MTRSSVVPDRRTPRTKRGGLGLEADHAGGSGPDAMHVLVANPCAACERPPGAVQHLNSVRVRWRARGAAGQAVGDGRPKRSQDGLEPWKQRDEGRERLDWETDALLLCGQALVLDRMRAPSPAIPQLGRHAARNGKTSAVRPDPRERGNRGALRAQAAAPRSSVRATRRR